MNYCFLCNGEAPGRRWVCSECCVEFDDNHGIAQEVIAYCNNRGIEPRQSPYSSFCGVPHAVDPDLRVDKGL